MGKGKSSAVGNNSPYSRMSTDELKALRKQNQDEIRSRFAGAPELDEASAAEFSRLMTQRDEIEYDLFKKLSPAVKQETLDKRNAERGAQTELNSSEIGTARTDMLKDKEIYMAIQSASHGISFTGTNTANTAVDNLYERNPNKFYRTFANTRKMLQQKYGDTITLYRATTGATPKATVNMSSLRSNAAQYGGNVVAVKVPVKDVLAVNVSRTGQYEEFIVLNKKRKRY